MAESQAGADVYDLKSAELPYLSGRSLRLFTRLLEGPFGGLLSKKLLKDGGITWLGQQQVDAAPTYYPVAARGDKPAAKQGVPLFEWPASRPQHQAPGFRFPTVFDYAEAYRWGSTTPLEVAQNLLKAVAAGDAADPPLRAMIAIDEQDVLQQAEASAKRLKARRPLSVFDGVPVAVKDELDMAPYATSVGTSFLGQSAVKADATIVAHMRAAGALLFGKANMHEIGIGVTGQNPIHGTPRNPYNPAHYTGGSSSGSAAAVAAGFCPVALGADGGGSIRIPAAFCGLIGLKPTFGRVSEFGAAPLAWSVAHLGPLAASAADAALAYAVLAGPDPKDPLSLHQPDPGLLGWDNLDLSDLTLGVYWPWFRHATADIVEACETMLNHFTGLGASIREIVLPDLEASRVAHVITIAGEMSQALNATYDQHHQEHSLQVRLNLALARRFTTADYVQAQRVRTRTIANFNQALSEVDVIITPASGLPAPPIPATAFPDGDSDLTTLTEIMRFVTPANLTGLPAIAFPTGYNGAGLPLGMQAIGRAWQETTLLRLALAAEQQVVRQKPQIFFDPGLKVT